MKILTQVLFVLLISTLMCDGNKRQKRTLNTFLRFFGYKIIPIDDVEFVTENIVDSARNPKAMRIRTQRPSVKVEVEETTTMRTQRPRTTTRQVTSTTMRPTITTSTQSSILKFNPLSPDIINSMFQNFLPVTKAPIDVRNNNMKKNPTLSQKQVKGTEFLIRLPMDMPTVKPQNVVNSIRNIVQSPRNMPKMPEFMQAPNLSGMMSPPMQPEMFSGFMEPETTQEVIVSNMTVETSTESMTESNMSQTEMPSADVMQNNTSMQQQDFPSNGIFQPQDTSGSFNTQDFEQNGNFNPQDFTQNGNFLSQDFGQNTNFQTQNFQQLPTFPAQQFNSPNFEIVKSVEVPQSSFSSQFIVGNAIGSSDFNQFQRFPFQTQFSSPLTSQFRVSRSGKGYQFNHQFNTQNVPATHFH